MYISCQCQYCSKERKQERKRKYKVDPKTGLKWYYPTKRKYTYAEALKYAKETGRRLPTSEEIQAAIDSGFLKRKMKSFWSSSVHPDFPVKAFFFFGLDGSVSFGNRYFYGSVRCLR